MLAPVGRAAPRYAALALLAVLFAVPGAAAQSGVGALRGLALPESAAHAGGAGLWGEGSLPDGALVELLPVRTLGHPADRRTPTVDRYGRYRFDEVPMGLYRLRVSAPGFRTWESETYIASDSESVVHVLLHPEAGTPGP